MVLSITGNFASLFVLNSRLTSKIIRYNFNTFAGYYFPGHIVTCEIRKNKTTTKKSAYTVDTISK